MKCKTRGKAGGVALKINISKDFDRLQWQCLFSLMGKMGFDAKWIGLIKICLETIKYLVKVNEDFVGQISLGT